MRSIKILITLVLLTCSCALFAATKQIKPMPDYQNATKPIMLKPGSRNFEITLESNLATGYSWFLKKYNANLIKPVTHMYVKSQSNKLGAPGHEVWTFQVLPGAYKVPQMSKIKFVLLRPWEKNQHPETRIFTVVFASKTPMGKK
ncbi:MAG: protease inhibitor I42 family protein [Pseudomonadota bacterium]